MRLKSTCKPRKGLGLFASLFASQLSFQLSTLSSLAQARVSPKQATPMFFDKFYKIVVHFRTLLQDHKISPTQRYILFRDLAFFTLYFSSGDRASGLGRVKAVDALRNSDGRNILIHQRIGKTLRRRRTRAFPVRQCKNPAIFPVRNLEFYMDLGNKPFKLLPFSPNFKEWTWSYRAPFLVSVVQARLSLYLNAFGMHDGESTHSFRGGTAILFRLLGVSKEDVAHHIG